MTLFKLQLLAFVVASAADPTAAKHYDRGLLAADKAKLSSVGGTTDIMSDVAAMGMQTSHLRPLQTDSDTPACTAEKQALGTCFSSDPSTDLEACLDCVYSYFPTGIGCSFVGEACAAADLCPSCGSCGLEVTEGLSCVSSCTEPVVCEESLVCPEEAKALKACTGSGSGCIPCIAAGWDDANTMCFEFEEDTCNTIPSCSTCSGCEELAAGWLGCIGGCGPFSCPDPTDPTDPTERDGEKTDPPEMPTSDPSVEAAVSDSCTQNACACTTSSGACPAWFETTYAETSSIGAVNGKDGYCAGGAAGSSPLISLTGSDIEITIGGQVIPADGVAPCPLSAPGDSTETRTGPPVPDGPDASESPSVEGAEFVCPNLEEGPSELSTTGGSKFMDGSGNEPGNKVIWSDKSVSDGAGTASGLCTVIAGPDANNNLRYLCTQYYKFTDGSTIVAQGDWYGTADIGNGDYTITGGSGCFAGVSGKITESLNVHTIYAEAA